MKIVVDGNDGTGKSTLVKLLAEKGIEATDRGIPTKMTDDLTLEGNPNEIYLILDLPVKDCQQRLKARGADLTEMYHTEVDLMYYRERFLLVAEKLENAHIIDASGTPEEVLEKTFKILDKIGGKK